jgi:prephenate dehydrogenase
VDTRLKKVAIIGLGLIGGSIGLALKRRMADLEIVGTDIDGTTLKKAVELGAVDCAVSNVQEDLAGVQLVVLAVPLGSVNEAFSAIAPYLPEGCVITDVASVKCSAIKMIEGALPRGTYYIGGHPMAGSEKCGIEAADPFLLEDAVYVLTPRGGEPREVMDTLESFIKMLGARPFILEPERHDFLVAMISHMPYLAAVCLNLAVSKMDGSGEALILAAGGFRDITRVASSHPGMWSGICEGNREALLQVITVFQEELSRLQHLIDKGEWDCMQECLEKAKAVRDTIPDRTGYTGVLRPVFGGDEYKKNLEIIQQSGYGVKKSGKGGRNTWR